MDNKTLLAVMGTKRETYITLNGFTAFRLDRCGDKPVIGPGMFVDDVEGDVDVINATGNDPLVNAAPDLLKACEYAAEFFEANEGSDDWWDEYGSPRLRSLRAAIAKATGEA